MTDQSELRHRPLVFVEDLEAPRIDSADLHHFQRVLRVSPGQPITLGDGAGAWREAEFAEIPTVLGPVRRVVETVAPITIGFVPVKGTRPEWVVQKLTELGIDRMVPLFSERSVVRWDEAKAARHHVRLHTAAREAAMQSRRLTLPRIEPSVSLEGFLLSNEGVAIADPEGVPMEATNRTLVIGPEGGFSEAELADQTLVALPGGILRAETAAVVAGAVACGLRAGLVRESPK